MTKPVRLAPLRAILPSAVALVVVSWAGYRHSGSADAYLSTSQGSLTFNEDIAPILFEHCAACHRPGGSAPFSLLTYRDVKNRARLIAAAIVTRQMPPWLPEPGRGEFANERRLSREQIEMFQQWVEDGLREGDPLDLPPAPAWPEGWHLGEPDLVVRMPQPYTLPADGSEVFRNFVIPISISGTRYVEAVELHPGNPRVVHHAMIMVDPTPASRRLDEQDPEPGYEGMHAGDAQIPKASS